jgi:uncharacterized RDD family membrane protein YckC
MIEPEVTAVLGRRSLAFLIDASLVVVTGLGVAFQTSTAFAVVGRDAADKALVDPAEFESMEEMLDFELFDQSEIFGYPVVRAQEIGDSVRVFSADSYQFGLIAAAVAALVLFGLVPAVLQRTIGMLPLGLGIRKTDGTRADVGAHLKRTIVGVLDAVPFVIPGVLGFVTSLASRHHQRLGDHIAKTVVVDLDALQTARAPGEKVELHLRAADEPTDADIKEKQPSNAVATAISSAPTGFDGASTFTEQAAPRGPTPIQALDAAERANSASSTESAAPTQSSSEAARPPMAKPTFGDPLPPPPVHRKAPSEFHLGTPSNHSIEDQTTASDVAASFRTASEVDAPTASAAEHLSTEPTLPLDIQAVDKGDSDVEVPDGAWQPPREEPAPVWQPTALETAPIEAPDPHDGRTIDDLERIDPSIGALLAEGSSDTETSTSTRGGNHSQHESSAKTPVWSDKWRAWMYWDSNKKCWLRHDTTSNTWQPVD